MAVTTVGREGSVEDMHRSSEHTFTIDNESGLELLYPPSLVSLWLYCRTCEQILTDNTPQLGYFLAGGMAGVVSRTSTAPLDRLKVYLIAQTGIKNSAIHAVKSGAPLAAVRRGLGSLVEATKELWRAGGVRSLFAGMLKYVWSVSSMW